MEFVGDRVAIKSELTPYLLRTTREGRKALEQLIGAVPYLVRPLDRWGLADSSKGRK
jgi:hypothetical protein